MPGGDSNKAVGLGRGRADGDGEGSLRRCLRYRPSPTEESPTFTKTKTTLNPRHSPNSNKQLYQKVFLFLQCLLTKKREHYICVIRNKIENDLFNFSYYRGKLKFVLGFSCL